MSIRPRGSKLTAKNKTAGLTGSSGRRRDLRTRLLCLNNSRRDEENQLLTLSIDHRVLEQVAQEREAAQ